MKIERIEICNFLTLGEAVLELADRGLVLIQGENADDTSAKSNGAGKSSLVDAICWALFGETARGVSGDDVVNQAAGKNCVVTLKIVDPASKVTFHVKRHRKHKEGKNSLQLSAGGVDLTKGTDKETQAELVRLLGCSHEVFVSAVYAGQERMPDLPGMTDKQLKLLIEEAAGTEVLAQAYEEARVALATAQRDLSAHEAVLIAKQASVDGLAARLPRLIEQRDGFVEDRANRAKLESDKAAPFVAEARKLGEALAALEPTELVENRIAANALVMSEDKAKRDELARLKAVATGMGTAATLAKVRAQDAKKVFDHAKSSVLAVDSDVGKPCGECGKPYSEHDLADVKAHRSAQAKKAQDALASSVSIAQAAKKEADEALAAAEAYEKTLPDLSAIAASLRADEAIQAERSSLTSRVATARARAMDAIGRGKAIMAESNPFEPMVEKLTSDIVKATEELERAKEKMELLATAVAVEESCVKVFGPAGVRAHILDTVTPALNEWTKEYLGALADGNIHATWTTLTKTAKGDTREKFSIEVTNTKGAASFGGMSGGEKRKVRLSCALALQDLVASRASKPIDLFIADEVDQALDEAGLERLMGVLERKARERGTVLVISHNSLADWIDNVITVQKKSGVSVATGATTASGAW